jgi:hypothetical protein
MTTTTTRSSPIGSTDLHGVQLGTPPGSSVDDDALQIAVVDASDRSPAAPDWQTPTLIERPTSTTILVWLLIGPAGGVVLQPGRYRIWVKVTDVPEVPWVSSPQTFRIV